MSNFLNIFKNKKILITGHTGFKGSWLTLLLNHIGAEVIGLSKPIDKSNKHFKLLSLDNEIISIEGDICNENDLNSVFNKYEPEFVFHLAAQSIVKLSYDDPKSTFSTNVMGSLNLLNAVNKSNSVKVLVYITSDKCYENLEWEWGYRENDRLGGSDPYSASKASAEILFSSFERSFFAKKDYLGAATARAGNVIGGGDWAQNRLIPDCIRSIENNSTLEIRNPKSTRPWQHVLEPLSGYLLLAYNLYKKPNEINGSWNFGPSSDDVKEVLDVSKEIFNIIGKGEVKIIDNNNSFKEANLLQLNCDKASQLLNWKPKWNVSKSLNKTADWYKRYMEGENPKKISLEHINEYFENLL